MNIIQRFKGWTRKRWAALLVFAIAIVSSVTALDYLLPPPIERALTTSPIIRDRNGQWLHGFTTSEGRWRFPAKVENIDPDFVERLVLIEDKRFYQHSGVDFIAIMRAMRSVLAHRRIVSGASTITMQTARLLEPRSRTLSSKTIEMIRALQIERRLSKTQILELYLTLAPYGGNIEGIRAASLIYFDKEPRYLFDAEQAFLIALPQAPEARRPDRRSFAAKKARDEILNDLVELSALSPAQADEAKSYSVPQNRTVFSQFAYHISEEASRSPAIRELTIDREIQSHAETLLKDYIADNEQTAIDGATASLLIVDTETMEVRASVGSSGLEAKGGWLDLTKAIRSPGSTFKPFIYALAFEDGFAGPDTVIEDMPRSFGDYSPENFDRTFRGQVRIREALQHSLNLPAVSTLDKVGTERFSSLLNVMGVSVKARARADKDTGLALALGGAGTRARDLAVLYAGLANGGVIRPLRWTMAAENETDALEGYRFVSEQNAYRIAEILRSAPSLQGRAPTDLSTNAPKIAFKTGTSYGYRDAWAAGFAGRYVAIVWVGRADGASRSGQTGREVAAPLLFDVFDLLSRLDNDQPNDVNFDQLAESQRRPSDQTLSTYFDRQRSAAPEITFPRAGSELYLSGADNGRGFVLSARGGAQGYEWYVSGASLSKSGDDRRTIWHPQKPGFYDIEVVDKVGNASSVKVRVHG